MEKSKKRDFSELEKNRDYWKIPYYRLQQLCSLRGINMYRAKKEEIIKALLEDDINSVGEKKMDDSNEFVEGIVVEQDSGFRPSKTSKTVAKEKKVTKDITFEERVEDFMSTQAKINEKLLAFLSGGEKNSEAKQTKQIEPKVYQVDDNTAIMSEVTSHKEKLDANAVSIIEARGKKEAFEINQGRADRAEIKDVYVASELNHTYNWKTYKIQDGIHYMCRG